MNVARLISIIAVVLIAWTIAEAEEAVPRVVSKPQAPLFVTIEPQGDRTAAEIQPGQVVELRIVIRSFIDLSHVSVTVSAAGGAEIVAGETNWSGPLTRDTMKFWNISVRASRKEAGKIIVRAEDGIGDKKAFQAEAIYEFGKYAGKKHPTGGKAKDRQGRDVIEYEVK